ncbi:bifunctional 5,10-methylenetetrahydrofolate dehydrogenase/5,10-methenyltetrahydrofolate cyclohydrolase [Mycoplasmoides alvi]|uniref:bifunctional 5,10-methylenetetrahydrofolate dehydrogenase/5,10-methenyltetrahydrofolate cyclohydrolase n=1 Tax=Mycoplasmoides alvi TaxID=78580 RepID=UPI00051C1D56|nr:bifunctional 5,10-methylenetetrahydrofolate dehydrogenase/5,10-methenyltetrahydrofolate cyclohydrolase [Mycoplasmoides alvi]
MIKLDGIKLAKQFQKELIPFLQNKKIRLDIIQIGNDYASSIYVQKKIKICKELNIKTKFWKLPESITSNDLISIIEKLNKNNKVNGILLQLPIPKNLNVDLILKKINPLKDVDVFNKKTLTLKNSNRKSPLPCLVGAIDAFRKKYKIPFRNKTIVVLGKGKTGGSPIINWYKNKYKIIALDKNNKNINKYVAKADILISAIGKTNVIDSSLIKEGAAFFDIGINRSNNNLSKKISGDINYEEAQLNAKWGTPVPGGIGPLTIIMLIKNLILLSNIQDEQKINNCL